MTVVFDEVGIIGRQGKSESTWKITDTDQLTITHDDGEEEVIDYLKVTASELRLQRKAVTYDED